MAWKGLIAAIILFCAGLPLLDDARLPFTDMTIRACRTELGLELRSGIRSASRAGRAGARAVFHRVINRISGQGNEKT